MSGLDEQIIDIPLCPECGRRPGYWTIYIKGLPKIWFYSFTYMETHSSIMKPNIYGEYKHIKDVSKKDDIVLEMVICKGENSCGSKMYLNKGNSFGSKIYRTFYSIFPDKMKEVGLF
jgi:hypothetical protein